MDFYKRFQEKCAEVRKKGRHVVVAGDVNTAFEDADLWNPKVRDNNKITNQQENKKTRRQEDKKTRKQNNCK